MLFALPYVLLICFLGACAYVFGTSDEPTRRRRVAMWAVAVFFVFFAFRGFIFSDWSIYHPFFFKCTLDDVINYKLGDFEPGYVLLNLLCRGIFPDYHFFVFVCSAINTALLLRFFRHRLSNLPLALVLFLSFEGMTIMTNLMRNSIAILLFLNALPYLEARRPLPYFSLCLLALTFHLSALLYFPVYFFFHLRYNKWIYLALFVVFNLVFLLRVSIFLHVARAIGFDVLLEQRMHAYTEVYIKSTLISIGYLERLLTGVLVFCYYDKLLAVRKENVVFINTLILYFAFFFLFSEFETISKRLALLFICGYWIIWYDLIKCFAIHNNRLLFEAFIMLYCTLKAFGINHPDAQYDNVLFGSKSYEERLYQFNKNNRD